MNGTNVVEVRKLCVELGDGSRVVDSASFAIRNSRVLGLVGESGCGKSTTALALLGHARVGARVVAGDVSIAGVPVLSLDGRSLRRFRGKHVSFVPQDPSMSLDPGMRVGRQIEEMLIHHSDEPEATRRRAVADMLTRVGLESTTEFLLRYPHQLSGGQQQRVAVAMALICRPTLIVLDEPTTGLDVTTQALVLETITQLKSEFGLSMLYVTHDLGVVSHFADDIAVMYAGRIVEYGRASEIFERPQHPYTRMLLKAIPRGETSGERPRGIPGTAPAPTAHRRGCLFEPRCPAHTTRCRIEQPALESVGVEQLVACFNPTSPLGDPGRSPDRRLRATAAAFRFQVEELSASYRRRGRRQNTRAVTNVSLSLAPGECVGIVGESGSGKTTLGRCIVGLHTADNGRLKLDGRVLAAQARRRTRDERRRIQIVFQNPDASLNPRQRVSELVGRPIDLFLRPTRLERHKLVDDALMVVRLDSVLANRRPSELSGGEKQRVAIARAIAPKPDLLICDEVTSALDVSVQAAILELLDDLRQTSNMSLIFISHDLAVVRSIADEILVLQQGVTQEFSETDTIFERPQAPYTRKLMQAQRDWSLEADRASP